MSPTCNDRYFGSVLFKINEIKSTSSPHGTLLVVFPLYSCFNNREVRESIQISAQQDIQVTSIPSPSLPYRTSKPSPERLLRKRVFEKFSGQTQCSEDAARLPITPSIVMFRLGCAKIATGFTAENYKDSTLKKNNDGRRVDEDAQGSSENYC
jgi:hypothetical protein